jgi:hypothetical protein
VTHLFTEYQFIKAKHTPLSFNAIHVPPAGSEGHTTARPFSFFLVGGKPEARVNFSSRFIPRQKPNRRAMKVTVHMRFQSAFG